MLLELALLLAYLIIPLLIFYDVISVKYRWAAFALGALFAVIVALVKGYTWHDLGFRVDNLEQADGYYYIMFFLAFGFSAYFKQNKYTMGYKKLVGKNTFSFKGLWFVPAQEFIFRSLMLPVLLGLGLSKLFIIPIMSLIFGFAHIPFHSMKIFLLTCAVGVAMSTIYVIFPNYFLVTILHAIIWITAVHFKII